MRELERVYARLAADWRCGPDVFAAAHNTFLVDPKVPFEVLTFGQGAAFRGHADMMAFCRNAFEGMAARWILDSENLFRMETRLRAQGLCLQGEHMRYLCTRPAAPPKPEGFAYRLYREDEVQTLWLHRDFDNALNFSSDIIALGAYAGDTLVSLAAADNIMDPLWQIGIDTLPAFRGHGLAAYLVRALTEEILRVGKIPFYTTWGANLASTRVALSTGYRPIWVGYHADKLIEGTGGE